MRVDRGGWAAAHASTRCTDTLLYYIVYIWSD